MSCRHKFLLAMGTKQSYNTTRQQCPSYVCALSVGYKKPDSFREERFAQYYSIPGKSLRAGVSPFSFHQACQDDNTCN